MEPLDQAGPPMSVYTAPLVRRTLLIDKGAQAAQYGIA